MASHLSVLSLAPSGPANKGSNAKPDNGAPDGIFSALVDKAAQDNPAAKPSNDNTSSAPADKSAAPAMDAGLNQQQDKNTYSEAVAAPVEGPAAPAAPVDTKPLVDFIDALGALRDKLDAGELLDPESLAELEAKLTELADALGLDLSALPIPEDFAALLAGVDAEAEGLSGTLLQLLTPLAKSLVGQQAPDTEALGQQAQIATQLKSLSDKLGAVLAALEQGEVPEAKLAAIGMAPDQPMDAEIEAALARFTANAPTAKVPDTPELATPALKLTEPALTGKAQENASAPAATDDAEKPAEPSLRVSQSAPTAEKDEKPAEPRAEQRPTQPVAAAPAATDASAAPAPSQANAQPEAIRLDAAANPRIVQTGYQTSQQQLNLPQIAFELARQALDGNTRFQIRLDPPELGRIDVRLDIDSTGRVNARLTVDRAETLDLMQRDQRALEKALQQAGLDSNKTNLEFSLKQNPFSGGQQGKEQADNPFSMPSAPGEDAEELPPTVNLYRGALQASGLDIVA